MAQKTFVKLTAGKEEQEFEIQHAQRILDVQKKNRLDDWKLSENQAFELKDGTITPTGTGKNKQAGQSASDN